MIKAIIVEDEVSLRILIKKFILDIDPDIEIVSECENIFEAEQAINEHAPDIIFLDVIMPRGSGMDLLEKMPDTKSEVIFITAHDKYVLDAFQFAAVGYVLKPIDKEKLKTAISNAKKSISQKTAANNVSALLKYLEERNAKKKIGVPTQEGVSFIDCDNIKRLEGSNSYTKIFFTDNTSIISSYNLSKFDKVLPPDLFFKIHKSHIISLAHVVKYNSKESAAEMKGGDIVPISKKVKAKFLSLFNTARN